MLNIKIELTRITQEQAKACDISAANFMPYEQETETDRLARDILAPLAVAELMRKEGSQDQKAFAQTLGEMFANSSAVCGSALWFCGSQIENEALTLPNSYKVRAFGKMSPRSCFILILENPKEKERAYIVRANW